MLPGDRFYTDILPVATAAIEADIALHLCKNRMVFADANIVTRVPLGATLANDDVTGDDGFATEFFDAKATANCIATVA